jgi:DNA-binding response OmpR family regulator
LKILVVEDEKKIAGLIKKGLEADSYQVTVSHNGADGLELANSGEFGILILDWMLPKKDGLAVLHELRETGNQIPVLMLTAKAETVDIVSGLDAGADDYLAKPFEFSELQARVRALIRRSEQDLGADIRYADLRIDPVNHKAWRGKTEIILSATEYRFLLYMVKNAEKPLSREDIAENCWDDPVETFSNIIDVYINYLRKKVDGKFPIKLIHTVRGKGYVLKEGK